MSASLKELLPNPEIIDVLRGIISEPIQTISHKPGFEGEVVTVRLALEGPGMHGLTDYLDNQIWWGISRMHQGRSGALAIFYGLVMQSAGHKVNIDTILNGMNVSHAGRRAWEEACDYPEVAPEAAAKRVISNETLGLRFIQYKVPPEVFLLVASLAYSEEFPIEKEVYDSLEHRLSDLADHQTAHNFAPLHVRMGDFLARNFFEDSTTEESKRPVIDELGKIIKRQRDFCLGIPGSREVNINEADDIMQGMGAKSNSPRSTLRLQLRNYLKDAETQALLINAGVDPDQISEQVVPVYPWEHKLRLEYVRFAKPSLIEAIRKGYQIPNTEWGQYAQMLLKQ